MLARAARVVQPRDADGVAFLEAGHAGADRRDDARAFVTRNERQLRLHRPIAVRRMEIRVADAARDDLDQHLAGPRCRDRHFLDRERLAEGADHGRFHRLRHENSPHTIVPWWRGALVRHRIRRRVIGVDHQRSLVDRQEGDDRLLGVVALAHVVLALHQHCGFVERHLEDVLEGDGVLAMRPELHPVVILGKVRRYIIGITVQQIADLRRDNLGCPRATVEGGKVVARTRRASRSGVRCDTREPPRAIRAIAREQDRTDGVVDRLRVAAGGVEGGDLVPGQVDVLPGRGVGKGLPLRRRQPQSLEVSRRSLALEVAERDQVRIGA